VSLPGLPGAIQYAQYSLDRPVEPGGHSEVGADHTENAPESSATSMRALAILTGITGGSV